MEWDSTEVLDFNSGKYLNEIQKKLSIYRIPLYADSEQIERLFRSTVKVSMIEVNDEQNITKGSVYVQKGKRGTYWSIKNVRFHVISFLAEVLSLAQSIPNIASKGELFILAVSLAKLIKQFGVDIGEEEMTVCVALYQACQRYVITDENVIQRINDKLEECDYERLNEKKVYGHLSNLVELGIVAVQDGKYQVVETLIIR